MADLEKFRVPLKGKLRLRHLPSNIKALYKDQEDYTRTLQQYRAKISRLQELLYADDRRALLLIFQGMDTAGKDGAIKHVFSGVNPQGCQIYSFKRPSLEDLNHDYMWRTTKCLPERGRIGVFNRSYYEEVLVVRVHPELLAYQKLPGRIKRPRIWHERCADINAFEDYLGRNGFQVVKFFLHISKKEQAKRLLQRIDDKSKNWKMEPGDLVERKFWPKYLRAYEECLYLTNKAHSPWYVVPADDKKNARLIIAAIVEWHLRKLRLKAPRADPEKQGELRHMRSVLLGR